jgi:8-oxo-dGTP diphosphatase
VTLYIVRHAKAGSRHDFRGDDRMRPLSASGQRQAHALCEKLVAAGVSTYASSPFLRCIETLQPAARACGVRVELHEVLAEGHHGGEVIDLLATLPDHAAVCSHGDVIPETIAALERRGCTITSAPEWRKGSVWVVERSKPDRFTTAHAWPPPET